MKNIIIGTAGHIDHGKTELVKAMTGIDADRLKEEKERGITIDLGFANMKFGEDLLVGFVDVPGHEKFVKNMLAGAAGIDLVLLVVAADESVKPQTVEHFEICKLLGVKAGIIALTKIDLVDKDIINLAEMEIRDLVKDSFMVDAPIVPVSSRTGEGIDDLKNIIHTMALRVEQKNEEGFARLPVDRSFAMKGFGTVVTGTLVSGRIEIGDELELLPEALKCRVRGIEVHGESQSSAHAGQRTALNLTNIGYLDVERGDTLATPGILRPAVIVDAKMVLLNSVQPLKSLAKVRFHYGTSEVMARLKLLESDVIFPGQQMYVQLRMEKPIVVLPGDRFIIRFYSPTITIGGGIIIDNYPRKHRAADPEVLRQLAVLESGSPPDKLYLLISQYGERGASLEELERRIGFSRKGIETISDVLISSGKVLRIRNERDLYLSQQVFNDLLEKVDRELMIFHQKNPLMLGMGKEELRRKIGSAIDQELFDSLLENLNAQGKIRTEAALIAHRDHRVRLDPLELEIKEHLEGEFRKGGLNPPTPVKILEKIHHKRQVVDRIYLLLLKEGRLIKVSEERVYHIDSLRELKEKLGRYAQNKSIIDIASFKELAGITRKNAIPILEYFDSVRITRRMGNERVILKENISKD